MVPGHAWHIKRRPPTAFSQSSISEDQPGKRHRKKRKIKVDKCNFPSIPQHAGQNTWLTKTHESALTASVHMWMDELPLPTQGITGKEQLRGTMRDNWIIQNLEEAGTRACRNKSLSHRSKQAVVLKWITSSQSRSHPSCYFRSGAQTSRRTSMAEDHLQRSWFKNFPH